MGHTNITLNLAKKLINTQFPEYSHLNITEVAQQGHDNRTYRIGNNMLIRLPTDESYALKVPIEYKLLTKLAPYLGISIPEPIKIGSPSDIYPYPFSIYKWLDGNSANQEQLDAETLETIAYQLAMFLKKLQSIVNVTGPNPGQHNWWRGDHISVYSKRVIEQISTLKDIIDSKASLNLWQQACSTFYKDKPVWIHGDFAAGNILIKENRLSGVIDFGGAAIGDPACDLVIAWTYLFDKSRDIFIHEIDLDDDTWLRARAWALWKATLELCQIKDKNSASARLQVNIINSVI